MRSMTGFGRGEAVTPDGKTVFRTEISSVNRKQLEIKLNLPKEMPCTEIEIRRLVQTRISRGALTLRVTVSGNFSADLTINRNNMLVLWNQLKDLAAETDAPQPRMESLMAVPGILEQQTLDEEDPKIMETLLMSVNLALQNLIKMRETEGENLRMIFEKQLDLLRSTVDTIEPLAAGLPEIQKEKLRQRLQDSGLMNDPAAEDRVVRELVIFSDRTDVTEEINRLRSHFKHFQAFLDNRQEALGRNMDFLMQEIFRELNTLGNKAGTTEISPLVVSLKTEVEKIREQVQNIE